MKINMAVGALFLTILLGALTLCATGCGDSIDGGGYGEERPYPPQPTPKWPEDSPSQ